MKFITKQDYLDIKRLQQEHSLTEDEVDVILQMWALPVKAVRIINDNNRLKSSTTIIN